MEQNKVGITVEEFETLIQNMSELSAEIDQEKLALKAKQEVLDELYDKAMAMLKESGKHSYKSEHGTVSISEMMWVTVPQTPEDKEKLFAYLKDKGKDIFYKYVGVNSQSINSYVREEWELAKEDPEQALNFSIPGLGAPKMQEKISFRKGKK